MKSRLTFSAAFLALGTMLVPASVWAETAKPAIHDVALGANQTLRGQVMSEQGQPMARVAVRLAVSGQTPAVAHTNDQGVFEFSQVKAGVYQLGTEQGMATVRAWAPNTAPPNARPGALLVHGNPEVLRGQLGGIGGPILLGVLVAAAIAIPLALDDGS